MPNPYDDIFESEDEKSIDSQPDKSEIPLSEISDSNILESDTLDSDITDGDDFVTDGKESLDEILHNIKLFQENAIAFAQLLSRTKAIDNKVANTLERLLFEVKDLSKSLDLNDERNYHKLLKKKFETIIIPMRSLAKIHLDTVQQFNRDIDKEYFSVEKSDKAVESERSTVIHNINIQRKILGDGANDLSTLKDALEACEDRMENFINAGGNNNISTAEWEIIVQDRLTLTRGQDHQFDFSVFTINMLDKTAISLGLYMQETSSQYFGKVMKAFEF